jgi:hypothetical protein
VAALVEEALLDLPPRAMAISEPETVAVESAWPRHFAFIWKLIHRLWLQLLAKAKAVGKPPHGLSFKFLRSRE